MLSRTPIHIAIPEPTSPQFVSDSAAYNLRSLPQYLHAIHSAGAIPIPIPLHETPQRVARILSTVHGILLPGSGADVDPQKYGEPALSQCGPSDPARTAVDELLIQDAFNLHKPILAICHGAQTLNVWCGGTLIQDIPTQTETIVNHAPDRSVLEAHPIQITPKTRLAAIAEFCHPERNEGSASPSTKPTGVIQVSRPSFRDGDSDSTPDHQVNSSHHQAIRRPGDNLVISAISPQDQIIEAVELASYGPDAHFVLAVQWHPERTYNENALSRAIFHAFIQAAESWTPRKIEESVLHV
jgi:putative glutamine amidotransferase